MRRLLAELLATESTKISLVVIPGDSGNGGAQLAPPENHRKLQSA